MVAREKHSKRWQTWECLTSKPYSQILTANIVEILKNSSYFSRFVTEEGNQMLMEEVSKDELKVI
jgi:hypothetical protein